MHQYLVEVFFCLEIDWVPLQKETVSLKGNDMWILVLEAIGGELALISH